MPDFQQLLNRTSRTFGLAVPLLADPLRHQMTLAYLLFRVADTLEDAERLTPQTRHQALAQFGRLLAELERGILDRDAAHSLADSWLRWQPVDHAGYLELLSEMPELLREVRQLDPLPRGILCSHARRTADGMSRFLASCDPAGKLVLSTQQDLKQYCYAVAGIVGEMITELFLLQDRRLTPYAQLLRCSGPLFGEALQLVNILKDAREDALHGRCYLPPTTPLDEVFSLAADDLDEADRYVSVLRRVEVGCGMIQFTELPILLARRTLELLKVHGPAAKLSRAEVATAVSEIAARGGDGYETPPCVQEFVHAHASD